MGIIDPTGFGKLTDIMNSVGSGADSMLKRKNPGVKDVRGAFDTMSNGPNMALPGGEQYPQGMLGESIRQMEPSATRSLYQAEPGRRMGLAGIEGGASELGSEHDLLGQHYRMASTKMLQDLLFNLGLSPQASSLGGGGSNILMQLLQGVI